MPPVTSSGTVPGSHPLCVAIVEDEFARGVRLTIADALQLAEDIVNATT